MERNTSSLCGMPTKRHHIISDLWYQPINENEIMVMIEIPNGNEYSICELSYHNHEQDSYEHIYNTCLEIAHDLGYVLEGEC